MYYQSFLKTNFDTTAVSRLSQRQLNNIISYLRDSGRLPSTKVKMFNKIVAQSFDAIRGTYSLVSNNLYAKGHLPSSIHESAIDLLGRQYFTNPLLLPSHFASPDFDIAQAPAPRDRASNSGTIYVTMEVDCNTATEFEETIAWTRKGNESVAPLSRLDQKLRKFKDYGGYSAVFSGGRSIHCHYCLSTEHILLAPFDASAETRLKRDWQSEAALMARVHDQYWDAVADLFVDTLRPSVELDRSMRRYTQLRRMPFGLRILDKSSVIGLPAGAVVPQLVLAEDMLSRAPRNSKSFIVPPDFSTAYPRHAPKRSAKERPDPPASVSRELLKDLQEICKAEFGEFPALVSARQEAGEWIFQFKNHLNDQRPGTIVRGSYRRLLIQGGGHSLSGEFYLPENMTAQELGDHVARRYGVRSNYVFERKQIAQTNAVSSAGSTSSITFADLKLNSDYPIDIFRKKQERAFPEAIGEQSPDHLNFLYREKLRAAVRDARSFDAPIIVRSGEGIGKTTAHTEILASEVLDAAIDKGDEIQRFGAFAFRSREQAELKAQELRRAGRPVIAVKPFREHYEAACKACGEKPFGRVDLDELNPTEMIARIRTEQPVVFAAMEAARRSIWTGTMPFDGGTTLLTMSHRAAALWPTTHLTRAWHNPAFDADHPEQFQALAKQLVLDRIVVDDPEPDDFILIVPEAIYDFISGKQAE